MCGIAGLVNLGQAPPPELAALTPMANSLRHRGPDEFGYYRDSHCGLVHTRLSIVDLASGQQPMASFDGRRWLVFNGEIFNYVELRAELRALGQEFRTQSDTEVILAAWEVWGPRALDRFNGQWAFALWTPATRELILSRDRVGVRPLYYAIHDHRLGFASEIKALFAGIPNLPRAFDANGIRQTLSLWSPLAPTTAFAAVRELPPGTMMVVRDGAVTQTTTYEPDFRESFAGSRAEAAVAVEAALARATSLRMLRADVEVGAYVSGGLDSSLIATLGLAAKGSGFRTFSLRFADAEFDEGHYQRLMSQRLGTTHDEVVVTGADIARVFPTVCRHAERPLLRTAPAPMYLLSARVREAGVKVVLTGEGADEMFAGYDIFREAAVRRFWARAPTSTARPRLLDRLYPYLARSPVAQRQMAMSFFGQDLARHAEPGFGHGPRWNAGRTLARLLRDDFGGHDGTAAALANLPRDFAAWRPLAQDQWLEIRTLLAPYLLSAQGDRMLMANSVEGRFPFLDRDVMALAHSLPGPYKLFGLDEKHILKRVARDLVPAEIVARPKQPYRAPDAAAFVGTDQAWVHDAMSPSGCEAAGVFAPERVGALWRKAQTVGTARFSNTDNMALCVVLSTHALYREVVCAQPDPTPLVWTSQHTNIV